MYYKGFICGMFDILHIGHIDILRKAKEQCKYLIVAVGVDEFIKVRKNRESIMPYAERASIVKSLKYVDEVVPQYDLDKVAAYKQYKFNVMFAGDDHINEDIYIKATKELKKLGVDTIYFPHDFNVSSTIFRNKVIASANTSGSVA